MSAKMNEIMRNLGRSDALRLREEAPNLDGTEIIAREAADPAWSHNKDYSGWKSGAPVTDEGQIWTLIQPHNAAHYEGRPAKEPHGSSTLLSSASTGSIFRTAWIYIGGSSWRCSLA